MSNTSVAETAIAGAEESPVVQKTEISDQEWLLKRQAGPSKEAEKPKPASEEQKPEGEEAPKEGGEAAPKEEAPVKDVLSKAKSGSLDDLTEEELSQLAKQIGSKAVARFGELTAKRRAAEERAAALEAQLAAKAPSHEPIANNPLAASIKTSAELEAKAKELKQTVDVLEAILDDSDGLGAEDVVGQGPNGESYTKKQVKERLRAARKAREEYLPDVAQRIAKRERADALRAKLNEDVRKQIPWLEDEKDDRTQQYKRMVADPRLKALEDADPEVAAQMPFLLAHAANSMYARRAIPSEEAPAPKLSPRPPSNPSSGAAPSAKPEASTAKQQKELKERLARTGSDSDWKALRSIQLSKRKVL
jgi:hypothetical protein